LTIFPIHNGSGAPVGLEPCILQQNDPELHHNTGVIWASNTSGPIYLYTFVWNSPLAITIRANLYFTNLITNTLSAKKQDVQQTKQDPTKWPPSDPYHIFHFVSATNMQFVDGDLHFAYDWVDLFHNSSKGILFTAKVRRSDLSLVQLDISGFLTDLYDFDYKVTDLWNANRAGAVVQAGYCPSISTKKAGNVFKTQVNLDFSNYPFSFNFIS
jgi:hypothetical protein